MIPMVVVAFRFSRTLRLCLSPDLALKSCSWSTCMRCSSRRVGESVPPCDGQMGHHGRKFPGIQDATNVPLRYTSPAVLVLRGYNHVGLTQGFLQGGDGLFEEVCEYFNPFGEIIARAPNGGLLCNGSGNFSETHHKHTREECSSKSVTPWWYTRRACAPTSPPRTFSGI